MRNRPPIGTGIGFLLIGAWGLISASGPCASAAAAQPASNPVGPRDKVEIRVVELPELDREFQVAGDGTIELPNIGKVEVAGLTESEIAAELRRRLEEVGMRRATVSVRITEYSRPVSVLGAVVNPGNRPIDGRSTLLDVLLMAGGLTSDRGRVIQVRRRAANGLSDQVEISVDELMERGDPAANIPIFAGDVVHVLPAETVRVSFLGEVNQTGNVTFRRTDPVTLLVAIAQAGGLTERAASRIRILRRQGADRVEVVANYRRILSGKDPDPELADGDIVIVKEAFF
jgi:polysaccharide export outer membrane protein